MLVCGSARPKKTFSRLQYDIVRSNQTFLSWQGQAIHDAAMKVLKGMDTWDIEAYFAEV